MAYSEHQWEEARGFFEAGLSLGKIEERTGISKAALSKKSKSEHWEKGKNASYVEARVLIAEKKETESKQSLNCADEVANDKIILFGYTRKNIKSMMGKIEDFDGPADHKAAQETIDRAGMFLGVVPRNGGPQTAIQVNSGGDDSQASVQIYQLPDNGR